MTKHMERESSSNKPRFFIPKTHQQDLKAVCADVGLPPWRFLGWARVVCCFLGRCFCLVSCVFVFFVVVCVCVFFLPQGESFCYSLGRHCRTTTSSQLNTNHVESFKRLFQQISRTTRVPQSMMFQVRTFKMIATPNVPEKLCFIKGFQTKTTQHGGSWKLQTTQHFFPQEMFKPNTNLF